LSSASVQAPAGARTIARWQGLAEHLAWVGEQGIIDEQPARLAEDLALAAALVSGKLPDEPREVRVVMLDATSPGACSLADLLTTPGPAQESGSPARRRVTRRTLRLAPSAGPFPVSAELITAPLVPDEPAIQPDIRAELIDAHAVFVVTSYRDVIPDPAGQRATEAAARILPWLSLASDLVAEDLLTLVVDGTEVSNSNPDSRLSWTRRQLRELLTLPPEWPEAAIREASSRTALEEMLKERAGRLSPEHLKWAWDAYGISAIAERTFLPFQADPVRRLTESALRRALAMFSRAKDELEGVLGSRQPGGGIGADEQLLPIRARQHQAWLVSAGLIGSLESAVPALRATIAEVASHRTTPAA
jgi:hypothetical protein